MHRAADVHVGNDRQSEGVMLTQANLAENAQTISREHRLSSADRVAAVLPLYHINAFAVTMLAPLAHGGSLVMPPKFSATGFWDMAIEHECTWLNVVPTIVSYLLESAAPAREHLSRPVLPLGFGGVASGTSSRLRGKVRHRHYRNDGIDRNSGAGIFESDRT